MIQIAYVSAAADGLASDEIFKIIEESSKNNLRDDLTGFLIFANGHFLQVVEGPEDSVDGLLQRLNRDPRHHSIEIVSREAVNVRSFPRWRMERVQVNAGVLPSGLQDLSPELGAIVRKFLEKSGGVSRAA